MDSECSVGRGSFEPIPYPGPIVGYMQGGVFLPRFLVEQVMRDHPVPPGMNLTPVRQAPLEGDAFTFSDILIAESETLSPEEAIAARISKARR